jgi:O-antigen/teichoic acid export membrane protein
MSFARDSLRTFIIRFSLIFVNMIGGIINARWLGPEGVGILALFFLIQSFAFRFGNLGFGSGFAFFIAKGKTSSKDVLKMAFFISCFMSLISCVVLLLVWENQFSPWRDIAPHIFYLSLLTIFPFFINNFLRRILSGQLNIKAVNISEVIRTICYIPILVFLVIILKLGVLGAACSLVLSQLGVFFYLLSRVNKKKEAPVPVEKKAGKKTLALEIWRYCRWNYLIMFVNFYLEQLPIIVLKYFCPNNIVGFFSIGNGLMQRTRVLPESFSNVLFPYTAASQETEAVKRTNMLCRNFLIVSACIGFTLTFAAKPIITILYGQAFLPAVRVFYAFVPVILFWPLSQFLTVHIAASGKSKRVFWLRIIALQAGIIACFFLIPRYGAVGAALSLSATYMVLTFLCVYTYVQFSKPKLSEIILPNKNDWHYIKNFFKKVTG